MEVHIKTITVTRKRTLKDGTIREFTVQQKYNCVGYKSREGTRNQKVILTIDQKAEMKKRYADGVKKKRLAEDYHLTFARVAKILDEA